MNPWFTLSAVPVLPAPWAQAVGLHLGWGLVLAALALWLAQRLTQRTGVLVAVVLLVLLWNCMPGLYTPAYWLGLAFQLPSLSAQVLCAFFLLRRVGLRRSAGRASMQDRRVVTWAVAAGVVLGWVLLLDTLAMLPFSLYAWGWSPWTVCTVALIAGLPWACYGAQVARTTGLAISVVALYALSRLPSGNVWDALLDPWLWLALHGALLGQWRGPQRP